MFDLVHTKGRGCVIAVLLVLVVVVVVVAVLRS